MRFFLRQYLFIFLSLLLCLFSSSPSISGQGKKYDLVYIWGTELESVLDYKENLESIFSPEVHVKIKVVKRGKVYGVIYDHNGSIRSVTQLMVKHGGILRGAELNEAYPIEDKGYHGLYNVSYGLGPNLSSLKKTYNQLYSYLGKDVGKNLFIEKVGPDNFSLIYRRRGDKRSTATVARRHARLLRKIKISTTILPENNNPVIYGEASHLDNEKETVAAVSKKQARKKPILSLPKKRIVGDSFIKTAEASLLKDTSSSFEKDIEAYIKKMRKKGNISKDEMTSWMVFDLARDKVLVDINADQTFQAASMIKPFVALAFFHKVKEGKIKYGPKSRRKMEAMIQRSSNSATNWVMRTAGGPAACEKLLKQKYGHLFKKTKIVEYIPSGGRTYRNSALPSDYVRFLRALWKNELPYGKELRRLMALPGRDRLYSGTPIPRGTLVYNKTGSTAHLCGDMGILVPRSKNGGRYPYVVVGIIERDSRPSDYGNWMMSRGGVIRQVSTLVYKKMKRRHKLL